MRVILKRKFIGGDWHTTDNFRYALNTQNTPNHFQLIRLCLDCRELSSEHDNTNQFLAALWLDYYSSVNRVIFIWYGMVIGHGDAVFVSRRVWSAIYQKVKGKYRDRSEYVFSQWRTSLSYNVVSHWLSSYTERSLSYGRIASNFPSEIFLVGYLAW